MTKPAIELRPNGPLIVHDLQKLVRLGTDKTYPTGATIALCRCGHSDSRPFCDGSHKKVGFTDAKSPDRVPDERKDYAGKGITIHDNRGCCAHAAICTDRLRSVFKLGEEPWIDPVGAPVKDIVDVVEACPSGALSYSIGGVEHRDRDDDDPRILVAPKGPYAIKGGVELRDVEWCEGASREHYDLCRCGQSKNKPFCDGTHWNVEFDDEAGGEATS